MPAPILAPDAEGVRRAAACIASGLTVAYPTETVYGLGADPLNEAALERLFAIKGRRPDQPVLLLVRNREDVAALASTIPPLAAGLMDRFWPGPLTLLLPARPGLSDFVTSRSGTVALRQASPGTALDLLQSFGRPITSTSANRSGDPVAATPAEAADLMSPEDGVVLDGACVPGAAPSTIVDATGGTPVVLRKGAIATDDI